MKKVSLVVAAMMLAVMFMFTACSGAETEEVEETEAQVEVEEETEAETEEETTEAETETETTTEEVTEADLGEDAIFALSYNGETVLPGDDMNDVTAKIGSPSSEPMEMASCMATGYDLLYTYSAFELESFVDDDGNETLISMDITSSDAETATGIKVGMSTSEAATQAAFEEDDGFYIYTNGDFRITLYDEGGKVESIFIESTLYD